MHRARSIVALFACMLGSLPAQTRATAVVSVVVVDAATGRALPGVSAAIGPSSNGVTDDLAGDTVPESGAYTVGVTDLQGRVTLPKPDGVAALAIYGRPSGHLTYHGVFSGSIPGRIALSAPTRDEQRELDRVNAFRMKNGVGVPLAFDQNLMLTARYWASVERETGKIGHTCATLGDPPHCVEFNAYYHALPGADRDFFTGQNAAFGPAGSWSSPEGGFEQEGRSCRTPFDWHTCGGESTGHFVNLMAAQRWVGLGIAPSAADEGTYFAMNIL